MQWFKQLFCWHHLIKRTNARQVWLECAKHCGYQSKGITVINAPIHNYEIISKPQQLCEAK